jgi:hypothetical protein
VITLDLVTERCLLTLHIKIFVGFFQYATINHSACIYGSMKASSTFQTVLALKQARLIVATSSFHSGLFQIGSSISKAPLSVPSLGISPEPRIVSNRSIFADTMDCLWRIERSQRISLGAVLKNTVHFT